MTLEVSFICSYIVPSTSMTEKAATASAFPSPLSTNALPVYVSSSDQAIRHKLAEKMAGEITLSDRPGEMIKKWRTTFGISQSCLAAYLKVSPSVISDYESGRRKCPGIFVVNKIVYALLNMDAARGGAKTDSYESILKEGFSADAIYDIHEYLSPMSVEGLIRLVKGEIVYAPSREHIKPLYGYTIVNSLKAILHLSGNEFLKLYGMSSERAMIFTGVSTGRSPLVAIRVTNLKPALIVIHGISASQVDRIAAKIAEIERVPLITTVMPVADIIRVLQLHDARY